MSLESLKESIQLGTHLKNDAEVYAPENNSDIITTFIELINYHVIERARTRLTPAFREKLKSLTIDEKAELALVDQTNTISALLIMELMEAGRSAITGTPKHPIPTMLYAIAITTEDLGGIDKANYELLYQFFVNARIKKEDATQFANENFITYLLDRLINEQRVIFTSIVINLTLLIDSGVLDLSKRRNFFCALFNKSHYIQGELGLLFKKATQIDNQLFDDLSTCCRSIDPFTKQVNYSLWLREGAKFLFLTEIRALIPGYTSTRIKNFDRKLELFKEINKFDRAFDF